jgi:hypothetical protein
VDEPKRSSEEPRTNENEREVEELEEIMKLQEMEEMVSEKVSRGRMKGRVRKGKGCIRPGRTKRQKEGTEETRENMGTRKRGDSRE